MRQSSHKKRNRNDDVLILSYVIYVAVPVLFEIVNEITGDWRLSVGKIVTACIGIGYLLYAITYSVREWKNRKNIDELQKKLDLESRKSIDYQMDLKSVSDLIAFATKQINAQAGYLDKDNNTQIRELNLTNLATNACSSMFDTFSRVYKDVNFTVNIYYKYTRDGKNYSKMIAHEGISTPKFLGKEKELKVRGNHYYCEKLMIDENPDTEILLSKREVDNCFKLSPSNSGKYLQYIAIPIIDSYSKKLVFLLEINVMKGKLTIPISDRQKVKEQINAHFTGYMDYMLQMIAIARYADIINNKLNGN